MGWSRVRGGADPRYLTNRLLFNPTKAVPTGRPFYFWSIQNETRNSRLHQHLTRLARRGVVHRERLGDDVLCHDEWHRQGQGRVSRPRSLRQRLGRVPRRVRSPPANLGRHDLPGARLRAWIVARASPRRVHADVPVHQERRQRPSRRARAGLQEPVRLSDHRRNSAIRPPPAPDRSTSPVISRAQQITT